MGEIKYYLFSSRKGKFYLTSREEFLKGLEKINNPKVSKVWCDAWLIEANNCSFIVEKKPKTKWVKRSGL